MATDKRVEADVPHTCERCGAFPAYLFDSTPLDERGTWERLCEYCIDEELEPWQGDDADPPSAQKSAQPAAPPPGAA